MTQRNFMNTNDVFPILDLINRKIQKGKGTVHHISPILADEGDLTGGGMGDMSQWEVQSFEVVRDTVNPIDPTVIKEAIIIYRNGAIDKISLGRGLNPPVPSTVPNYEYINNLMLVEVTIETTWFEQHQTVTATIFKEDGYGVLQKVELSYDGVLHDTEEPEDETIENELDQLYSDEFADPNDFYDGASDSSYDDEADTAEDYADIGYEDDSEPELPEDGFHDPDPTGPHDVPIDSEPDEEWVDPENPDDFDYDEVAPAIVNEIDG